MIFSMDLRRAAKGDCFLLHTGTKDEPGLIMVDGGPKGVYAPQLKPRIAQIREARSLGPDEPLDVDLLMVSHVDDDHIQGILDLTKEMMANKEAHRAQPLQVFSFWHNSFDNIIGNRPDELTAAFTSSFGPASMEGELPDDVELEPGSEGLDEETVRDSLKVLASIGQGSMLRSRAQALDFPPNPEFDGQLVMATDGEELEVASGLVFRVVGPMRPELEALHKQHEDWLKDLEKEGKSPPDALASYVDRSIPNLSSIVVLATCDSHAMLLTGDARGDKILEGLQQIGALLPGASMHVDLLKVPHHGSANNLDHDFFERIIADHYVFSGDGKHGNPEREALKMLGAARGDADYTIHLTYPLQEIDEERRKAWINEQGKEKRRREKQIREHKTQLTEVREAWSAEKHGLVAFFDQHPELKAKLRIVKDGKAHVIDLADSLGEAWPELAA